jgi:hypothetical protein
VIVSWLTFLLTKQKRNDYRPKDEDLSFARTTTEPCQLCCEFLGTVKEQALEGLSGKNAEAFLTEVGVAFHRLVTRTWLVSRAYSQSSAGSLQEVPCQSHWRSHAYQVSGMFVMMDEGSIMPGISRRTKR